MAGEEDSIRRISIHALLTESDQGRLSPARHFKYFNPRSPHGERPSCVLLSLRRACISIHALLTESDIRLLEADQGIDISIHALLTESDLLAFRFRPV